MLSGTLTSSLRPIRIAFVIPPRDRAAALEAVRINSFLWGGSFNPIIPYYRRIPRDSQKFHGASCANDIFQGYLRTFDPDFVVRLGSTKEADIDLGNYKEIDHGKILGSVSRDWSPAYGVGLVEILNDVIEEEFRFVRKDPVSFDIPDVKDNLLWSAIFGGLHPKIMNALEPLMQRIPGYGVNPCELSNYFNYFASGNNFIRRLTAHKLEAAANGDTDPKAFLMDSNSITDIVMYWNLRALGWRILPVPVAAIAESDVMTFASTFVDESYRPYPNNPTSFRCATLMKGDAVDSASFAKFSDLMNRLTCSQISGDNQKFTTQDWVPRIWSAEQDVGSRHRRVDIQNDIGDIRLTPIENVFDVKAKFPGFAASHSYTATPRCANDLQISIYGETGVHAEVIPAGGRAMVEAVVNYGFLDFRCSTSGLVYFPKFRRSNTRLALPESEEVFGSWFKERGWAVNLSDNGRIVKHVLKQLGGIWGTNLLTDEAMFSLLDHIADKKWLNERDFRNLVRECSRKGKRIGETHIIDWLIKGNIVRLGVELKCPECHQRSWYSMEEAGYQFECRQCLSSFALPSSMPKSIKWAYRGNGAFTSRHGTQGGLAVILTLRMFSLGMHERLTPLLSFNANKEGKNAQEIDLALLTKEHSSLASDPEIFFVECKSYNTFEKRDVERMTKFATDFRSSSIVFATLRRELTKVEIQMFLRIVKSAEKSRNKGNDFPRVIILTGNELFSPWEPWGTWRELKGRFSQFADRNFHVSESEALAEATQKLYLGFDRYSKA